MRYVKPGYVFVLKSTGVPNTYCTYWIANKDAYWLEPCLNELL